MAAKPKFLGFASIAVDAIRPNPHNPRKVYHFDADNPRVLTMADSLRVSGQHNPIKVYELLPEEPGQYMLVQGHRRVYSAKLAGIDSLECEVISRPSSLAEELDWLGSEDSLKDEWGPFSKMEYARDLAIAYDIPITDKKIQAKTGLSAMKLSVAERMFLLEKPIWAHVVRWEEYSYFESLGEQEAMRDFPTDSGIKISDFPPEKAALTWDIFLSLRKHCASITEEYNDLDLQTRIAISASRSTMKDLQRFKAIVDSMSRASRPGSLSQIANLLESKPGRRSGVKSLVHTTRNTHAVRLVEATKSAKRLADTLQVLDRNIDQLGFDIDTLNAANNNLLSLLRYAERFQTHLERYMNQVERGAI